mgnify:CR=1 FL=1
MKQAASMVLVATETAAVGSSWWSRRLAMAGKRIGDVH